MCSTGLLKNIKSKHTHKVNLYFSQRRTQIIQINCNTGTGKTSNIQTYLQSHKRLYYNKRFNKIMFIKL